MSNGWMNIIAGAVLAFCGAYLFFKNSFEEGKSVKIPILLMIAGVCFICWGMAQQLKLVG